MNSYRCDELQFASISGHPLKNFNQSQSHPIYLSSGLSSMYIPYIQPNLSTPLDFGGRNESSICCIFLYCLTASHFYPKIFIDLLHCSIDLISVQASMMLYHLWFPCEWHPWIPSLDCKHRSTLNWFHCGITCGKPRQGKPLYLISLLENNEHSLVLFHTCIYLFSLAICLKMECCWHWSINLKTTTYLTPESWGELRPPVRDNCCWWPKKVYNTPEKQLGHVYMHHYSYRME